MNRRDRAHEEAIREGGFFCELRGGELVKLHQGRVRGTAGTPDTYFRFPCGLRGWWEVKTFSGRLSAVQKAWVEAERAAGGTVIVGDLSTFVDEVERILKALDRQISRVV